MAEPIPQIIEARSPECQDLGHVIDYFPTRNYRLKRWPLLLGGIFAILAAIGLFINLYIVTRAAIQAHGPAIFLTIIPMPIIIYILLLIIGIIFVILAKLHWWDSITLFESGLIKEKGNKVRVWKYQDTERFDNKITQTLFGGSIISEKIKIVLEDGSKQQMIIRNRYSQMPDLAQTIRDSVLPGLFQRARQHLEEGQVIHFGDKLKAHFKGLEINKEIIAYNTIATKISQHSIALYKKTDSKKLIFKSDISKIRNLDLLLELIENPPEQID